MSSCDQLSGVAQFSDLRYSQAVSPKRASRDPSPAPAGQVVGASSPSDGTVLQTYTARLRNSYQTLDTAVATATAVNRTLIDDERPDLGRVARDFLQTVEGIVTRLDEVFNRGAENDSGSAQALKACREYTEHLGAGTQRTLAADGARGGFGPGGSVLA